MSWMASVLKSIRHLLKGPQRPTSHSTDPYVDCNNCGEKLSDGDVYCRSCGQKIRADRLTLKETFSTTLDTVFGYDAKIWNTFRYIFIPGYLARMYQSGRRKAIFHPVRLFFFLFLILTFFSNDMGDELNAGFVEGSGAQFVVTTKKDSTEEDSINADSVVVEEEEEEVMTRIFVFLSMDSLCYEELKKKDIAEAKNVEEIYEKYDLYGHWGYFLARQQVKFLHTPSAYSKFLFSSLIWVFLLSQPLLAFFLLLLFWKRTYFSDHLVWSLYLHSGLIAGLILMSTVGMISGVNLEQLLEDTYSYLLILFIIYTLLSVKFFYKKSIFATVGLMIYITIVYMIIIASTFILNLLVSFFLF